MDSKSDNKKNKNEQKHNRFRDGIIWGILASFSMFFLNLFVVIPVVLIFTAVAGYRGKSLWPAFGTIATVFLFVGIWSIILYFSMSGINR